MLLRPPERREHRVLRQLLAREGLARHAEPVLVGAAVKEGLLAAVAHLIADDCVCCEESQRISQSRVLRRLVEDLRRHDEVERRRRPKSVEIVGVAQTVAAPSARR